MTLDTIQVKNANRMMIQAKAHDEGVDLAFADGCRGLIRFADVPEIGSLSNLDGLELPNPYELVLRNRQGETVELPWDFARACCDPSYKARIGEVAAAGRSSLAKRIRLLRESAGKTQQDLAAGARIGRVTLVRIESGEWSPRYQTLLALANALGCAPAELLGTVENAEILEPPGGLER